MKQYSIQIAGIIGICFLMLTACSNESPADNTSEGKELVVSAEIIPSGESKAVGAATNGTDKLSFVKDDQILITRATKKKTYKLSQNNQWLPETGGDDLTVDGTEQTYTASFPHDFTSILEKQNEAAAASGALSNYEKSNKLISKVTTASNYVPFKFSHAFSKITVIVAYKNKRKNVSAKLVGKNIRTDGATTDETIQMLRISPTDGTAETINHTFICILNPGTLRGFKLTVSGYAVDVTPTGDAATPATGDVVSDETYIQKAKEFNPGFNYVYNFSSNDNLILTGVKVVDFEKDGADYDAGNAT